MSRHNAQKRCIMPSNATWYTKLSKCFVEEVIFNLILKWSTDASHFTLGGRGSKVSGLSWRKLVRFPNVSSLHLGELRRYWSSERRGSNCVYVDSNATRSCGAWSFSALQARSRILNGSYAPWEAIAIIFARAWYGQTTHFFPQFKFDGNFTLL